MISCKLYEEFLRINIRGYGRFFIPYLKISTPGVVSIHLNNRSYVKTLNQASQLIYRIQEFVRPVQRGTNMNSFIHQHPAMMLAPVRGVGGCHNYF